MGGLILEWTLNNSTFSSVNPPGGAGGGSENSQSPVLKREWVLSEHLNIIFVVEFVVPVQLHT